MNKPIIMCVDDERQVLDSLRRDINSRHNDRCSFELCESAEEAMEVREEIRSKGDKIAIYIVDQRMPGMKGIELLKKLEKEAGKILLTAYADTDVAIEGINSKCIDFYVMKPYGNMLFYKINHLLMAFDQGYYIIKARTGEERQEALALQDQMITEEFLQTTYEKSNSTIEESPYDPITEMFVAVRNKEIVGVTSLNRINSNLAEKHGTLFGLPIEDYYDLGNLKGLDENLVQLRTAYVKPEYQNLGIGPMIWREIFREVIVRASEPSQYALIYSGSHVKDANTAMEMFVKLKKLGLYDEQHVVQLRDPESKIQARIKESQPKNIALDPLLKLYSRIGFKSIGEPCYFPSADVYTFPMLIDREQIKEPFKSYFLRDGKQN